MDFQDITHIYHLQKQHKQLVKNESVRQRIEKLKKIKQWILEHRTDIQQALHQDFKKPAFETDITEIYPAINQVNHIIGSLPDWASPLRVDASIAYLGTQSEIRYEPKGQCLIIAPWNYPFLLVMSPLMLAISAGNVAIIKPSEFAPHIAALLKKMLLQLFEEKEIAVIEGDHKVSEHMLSLKFDHIFFTGSPKIGKIVMKAAAHHLTSVTLELGGKSPVIIDHTADLAKAAEAVIWGKILNNGQTCIEPDYVLLPKELEDSFIEFCKQSIEKLIGKDIPSNPDYCRIIDKRHCKRIIDLLEDAKNKGAVVRHGGHYDLEQCFIEPTILSKVTPQASIYNDEIFGPVVYILPFDTLENAIQMVNALEKPLALYIFSKDKKNQDFILQNTSAGGTCINDLMIHYTQPNLPFGGVNHSGIGKTHGQFGFIEFSNQRAVVHQKSPFPAAKLLYPPYDKKWKKTIVNLMLKFL